MKNRQKKKLLSMLLTFAIVMGLMSALTATVGAIPPSLTRTFNINWTIAAGSTSTGVTQVPLNGGDFFVLSLTFAPQGTVTPSPRTVDIGIVNATGTERLNSLSMGSSGNTTNNTRWMGTSSNDDYRFRIRNHLGVPVRVTGTFTYEKAVQTLCEEGGLANRTVTIHVSRNTVHVKDDVWNDMWLPAMDAARNSWNNAGVGANVTMTTTGTSNHTLRVSWYSELWDGFCVRNPEGNVVATSSVIQINVFGLGVLYGGTTIVQNRLRQAVIAHEIGHLFWLGDIPKAITQPALMREESVYNEGVFNPMGFDTNNIRWIYG